MKQVTVAVDDVVYNFYREIGRQAGGRIPEQVMEDVLRKLAGELSGCVMVPEKKSKPQGM